MNKGKQRHTILGLVVCVLGILGGMYCPVGTEDVAIKAHELFSDSFSWINYPEIPDKELVRRKLINACSERFDTRVTGRPGRGTGRRASGNTKNTSDKPDEWSSQKPGGNGLKVNVKVELSIKKYGN